MKKPSAGGSDELPFLRSGRLESVLRFRYKGRQPVAAAEGTAGAQLFHVDVHRHHKVASAGKPVRVGFPAHIPPEIAGLVVPAEVFHHHLGTAGKNDAELKRVVGIAVKIFFGLEMILVSNIKGAEYRKIRMRLLLNIDLIQFTHGSTLLSEYFFFTQQNIQHKSVYVKGTVLLFF